MRNRVRLSLRIPERISVVDWLQNNIYLSTDTTRKTGKLKAHGYQREMLEAMGDPDIKELVFMKSIRVGLSENYGTILPNALADLTKPFRAAAAAMTQSFDPDGKLSSAWNSGNPDPEKPYQQQGGTSSTTYGGFAPINMNQPSPADSNFQTGR
jgi:hypothetical protein